MFRQKPHKYFHGYHGQLESGKINCRLNSTTIEELRVLTERKSGKLSLF
ncbi:hypothetical protein [Clostridioides sp. ES-S-0190-01]